MRTPNPFDGWTVPQYRKEILRLRKENAQLTEDAELVELRKVSTSAPDEINDSKQHVEDAMVTARRAITPEKIETLINNILNAERPNPMAIREIARLAGADVTEKVKRATGKGVDLIIIRPHSLLLEDAPGAEMSVQRQIAQFERLEQNGSSN